MIPTAEAVALAASRLAAAGIEEPRREARILLAAACGTDAAGLLLLPAVDEAAFAPWLARRAAREPLAYITGAKEFWGLRFATSPATLIPRPDSETLIEAALAIFARRERVRRILDLGTGTGCLLLAALHEFPAASGVGIDLSAAAAELAAGNARQLGFAGRAAFLAGNWAAAIDDARFDLVLSNPPYIATGELAALLPELAFEPAAALHGGADGLAAYRVILRCLPDLLTPAGAAVLELGAGQAGPVGLLARQAGFDPGFFYDLGGHARAITLLARK